jgi:hypothetical protein
LETVAGTSTVREVSEVPDLKNGATELAKRTEKIVFFVLSVAFVAPFLKSGSFSISRCL